MTAIQIITFETKEYFSRVMIEEFSQNNFRAYASIRLIEKEMDTFFTPFQLVHDTSTIFLNAKDALQKVIDSQVKDNEIVAVNNQTSNLLTSSDISNISHCVNIIDS